MASMRCPAPGCRGTHEKDGFRGAKLGVLAKSLGIWPESWGFGEIPGFSGFALKHPGRNPVSAGWSPGSGDWNPGSGGWNPGTGGWSPGPGDWNHGSGGWNPGSSSWSPGSGEWKHGRPGWTLGGFSDAFRCLDGRLARVKCCPAWRTRKLGQGGGLACLAACRALTFFARIILAFG